MAFIIGKKSTRNGQVRRLYYLVENSREGRKIKRKTLLALKQHANLAGLLAHTEQEKTKVVNRLMRIKNELHDYLTQGKMPLNYIGSPYMLQSSLGKSLERVKADFERYQVEIDRIKSFM